MSVAAPGRDRPRLIIHIGSPKTGTTAIQQYLFVHRAALLAQGVLYPVGGSQGPAHHPIGAAIFPSRRSRLRGASPEETLDRAVADIRAEIDAHRPHTIVLSTEYLWGEFGQAHMERLLRPFADLRISVLAYLRRQDLLIQSLYVQSVKGGNAASFADWYARARESANAGLRYDRVLRRWRKSGVPARIMVRVYERGQIDRDIRRDFLNTICPGLTLPEGDDAAANVAPDMLTVELMRRINTLGMDPREANQLRRRMIAASTPRGRFARLAYLSALECRALMDEHAEANRYVATEFLGRADGVLFREPVEDEAEAAPAPTDIDVLERLVHLMPQVTAPRGRAAARGSERRGRLAKEKIRA